MRSRQITFGSAAATSLADAERQPITRPASARAQSTRSGVVRMLGLLLGFALPLFFSGCDDSVPIAEDEQTAVDSQDVADLESTDSEEAKPKRLARGEMPEEWIEPQRERLFAIDTSADKLDLTFDDLKFDIEVGEPFERSLLSEKVKALHGKQITLSGYMRPAFKTTGIKGFIFVRDDKECCFGPQAAIYDCVRVKLKKETTSRYLVRPFKVRGTFYLKEREGPDGAIWSIFNMKNATIES